MFSVVYSVFFSFFCHSVLFDKRNIQIFLKFSKILFSLFVLFCLNFFYGSSIYVYNKKKDLNDDDDDSLMIHYKLLVNNRSKQTYNIHKGIEPTKKTQYWYLEKNDISNVRKNEKKRKKKIENNHQNPAKTQYKQQQ